MAVVAPLTGLEADLGGMRGQQAVLLDSMSATMDNTPGVFAEATRNRNNYQKLLVQKLEETLRLSKSVRTHLMQKSKHVRETAGSCTSKFEHEMCYAQNRLRDTMSDFSAKLEQRVVELEQRMADNEDALQRQREMRIAHIEATLGPIRDEAARIAAALTAERKTRKLQEAEREKMLADEIEAITRIIDKEKFDREQQFKQAAAWADSEEQKLAKHQYQLDKEIRERVRSIRVEHQAMTKDRIEKQEGIVETIANFMMRYREKMHA